MKPHLFKKILIANRGEIAIRGIRACRDLGIASVAVYSDADRAMPHVAFADEAHHIGPSPSRESYLVIDKILDVARKAKVDAVWPGYGFVSENHVFAQQVADAGFVFIGPSPASIRAMGDKAEARRLVMAAGVPTVPGTPDPVSSEMDVAAFCKTHGFPILIKAAAGGGGKGMRIVHSAEEIPSAFAAARSEAKSAFGDDRVYVEKYLERPRHVEFQILGDRYGTLIHLGERECTIQRRHQKVVEESPSPILDDTLRSRMGEMAVRAAKACSYHNAGTIEFLVDKDLHFYFIEMNTRLQVEHPITELRTGIDLVRWQIRIAQGERLAFKQEEIEFRGHAIECRIYAEDPANDFFPSTGRITHLRPALGPGIREDRGVDAGGEISIYYDPMISKLAAWGSTRDEAIQRMQRALREYEILGLRTNIPANLFILNHPFFSRGDIDTHFLTQHFKPELLDQPTEREAMAAAILAAFLHHEGRQALSLGETAARNGVRDTNSVHAPSSKWRHKRIDGMR
jgi:acetyl-CoA carboxylase biotin carboxylase subunit